MAKLNEKIRRFIVMELAMYSTPSEVAKAVGEEFGVEINRQQVYDYNPKGARAREIARKWHDLFDETRARFKEEVDDIPIANKAYRLRRLDEMHRNAAGRKNYPLAGQFLEQAAKEVGDAYTNRQKLEHSGDMTVHLHGDDANL